MEIDVSRGSTGSIGKMSEISHALTQGVTAALPSRTKWQMSSETGRKHLVTYNYMLKAPVVNIFFDHETDPQSKPVVVIIFARVVSPPNFLKRKFKRE